jgi:hypothetical protein
VCRIYLDWAAICYVDPTAVIAATTWKFEGVEAFVIEHCQTDVAIFRYCLEDEMPHERPLGDIRRFRIDLAQSCNAPLRIEAERFDVSQLPDRFVAAQD